VITVNNFTYGILNPALGFGLSCLGSFLGLRCVTLARAYQGAARARWLALAAVAIGAIGIWSMHFIAMLGFTMPGEKILYNIPLTIASMLLAVVVVGVGLFIVGFGPGFGTAEGGKASQPRLLTGGAIIGVGVAGMHYLGMAAMSMAGTISYKLPLLVLSVVIAIVAGTAALWIGTWVSTVSATAGAALIMGVAVTGMHYTGIAAMKMSGSMSDSTPVSGATAGSFLIPLLFVLGLCTFLLTLTISLTPSEDEIQADKEMRQRLEYLQQREAMQREGLEPRESPAPRDPANRGWFYSQSLRRNTQYSATAEPTMTAAAMAKPMWLPKPG
jgi:NO-binding membrane sensor protein with MHYT domain